MRKVTVQDLIDVLRYESDNIYKDPEFDYGEAQFSFSANDPPPRIQVPV